MQMTQSKCHRQWIKLGSLLRELPSFSEMHEELTTSYEFHDEENLLVSLEDVLHTHQKGVISFLQYLFLKQSRLNLVVIYYDILS